MGDFSQQTEISKPRVFRHKLVLAIVLVLLVGVIGTKIVVRDYVASNLSPVSGDPTAEPVTVKIPSGASTARIAQILADAKLIRNPKFFALYARYKHYDGSFRHGEYSLSPTNDLNKIMAALRAGPLPVRVTIPEGYTTKQIADLLVQHGLVDRTKFFHRVRSYNFKFDFLSGLPPSDARLEGFLFPDTYDIEKGVPEEKIIAMLLGRFNQELTPEIKQFMAKKGWTPLQFVTLASLIEKEAEKAEDRPVISQVFQKRLQIGMPLQSCASIQFLLGFPKPVLTYDDLAIKSPYNTYLNKGLPPGPIANPGRASLQAAAFPAGSDFLYFVAKPDGYHAFAKTYQEHLNNIKKYQR